MSLLQVKIKWINLLDLIINLNLNGNIWTTNSADGPDVHKSLLHIFQVQMWHIWWGDFSQKSKCQHTKDTTGESRSISRVKIRIKKQCTKNNIKTVYKSKQTGDGELRQVLIKTKLEHDAQRTVRLWLHSEDKNFAACIELHLVKHQSDQQHLHPPPARLGSQLSWFLCWYPLVWKYFYIIYYQPFSPIAIDCICK